MKKNLFLLSVVFLSIFSCTDRFFTETDRVSFGLNNVVFPEPKPFVPDPIEVSGLTATVEKYINQIDINWNTVSAGVYYWRLFWFADSASATAAFNAAQSTDFYKTEDLSGISQVSPRLSYVRNNYQHSSIYDEEGNEELLSSGTIFYYLLKGYDGSGRIVAYSEVAIGKTAEVPYEVNATRNFQPSQMEDPAQITLSWKWNHPESSFRIERAQAPFSQHQQWEDRGIVKTEKNGDYYIYTEEFKHGAECSFSSEKDFSCNCQIGQEFAYRIYAVTDGKSSKSSQIARGLTIKWGTPAAVEGVSASQGTYGGKISLTWDDASDQANFKGYSLYIKEKANADWERKLSGYKSNKYDFITKSLNKMQFYVTASNHLGEGVSSAIVTGYILPQVKNPSATLLTHESQITVTWNPVTVEDSSAVILYDVYRNEEISGDGELIDSDLSEVSYIDEDPALEAGKVYYYAIQPKNAAATPAEDGLGQKSAFQDACGVKGVMPKPEISVSTGAEKITVTLTNKPDYCYSTVNAKRWFYTPSYTKKTGAASGTPSSPQTYEHTLQFINRWSRSKREVTVVVKSSETVIVDTDSAFGINDYTVYYCFEIPEISFSAYSEVSEEKSGWRQISNEEFLINALRVIEFSQSYLKSIHLSGLDAKDFDSVAMNQFNGWSGDNCGGKGGKCSDKKESPNKGCFHYNPNVNLGKSEVTVPLVYNDFEAFDMVFNSVGTGHQTKVSFSANGKLTGTINVGGIYPGKIVFDLTITSSVKSGGAYKVQQSGKSEQSLPWDVDRKYFNK